MFFNSFFGRNACLFDAIQKRVHFVFLRFILFLLVYVAVNLHEFGMLYLEGSTLKLLQRSLQQKISGQGIALFLLGHQPNTPCQTLIQKSPH